MILKPHRLPRVLLFSLLIPAVIFCLASQAKAQDSPLTCSAPDKTGPVMAVAGEIWVPPCIALDKTGPVTAVPGETITYQFIVTNCGSVNFASGIAWVVDPLLSSEPLWESPLNAGDRVMFTKDYLVTEADCGELINTATAYGSRTVDKSTYAAKDDDSWTVSVICPFCGDGVLDQGEECDDGNNIDGDGCSGVCTIEFGGEGCTPGYWKQYHHFDSWPDAYTPNTMFSAVFEDAFPGKTLLDVLKTGEGGLYALGRHTVAALLNAASTDVDYDRSAAKVIDMFNSVYPGSKDDYEQVKNIFSFFNEQMCPLN